MTLLKIFCLLYIFYVQVNSTPQIYYTENWKYFKLTPIHKDYGYKDSYVNNSLYLEKGNEKIEFFNPEVAIPIDLDEYAPGGVFLVIDGKPNVQVTLVKVKSAELGSDIGSLVQPYPDYSWHLNKNSCVKKMVNVRSVNIDRCKRLWALDTGILNGEQICPPRLHVFDLQFEKHLDSHILNWNLRGPIGNFVVHVWGNPPSPKQEKRWSHWCDQTSVYVTDANSFHSFTFTVGDKTLNRSSSLYDLSESFTPKDIMDINLNTEDLYVSSSADKNMLVSKISKFESRLYSDKSFEAPPIVTKKNVLKTLPTALQYSSNYNAFLISHADNTIDCFALKDPLSSENMHTVFTGNDELQHITSMKIPAGWSADEPEKLYILKNRQQNLKNGRINLNKNNFRVEQYWVRHVVKGTHCDIPNLPINRYAD